MTLRLHDLHLLMDDTANRLKVFRADGSLAMRCEARNATVRSGQFGRWGPCPRGEFGLGRPRRVHKPALGNWAIPLYDLEAGGALARFHRVGVLIHGGGSGLADPYAPAQGWTVTHGCLRLQNRELAQLVALVQQAQQAGGRCTITVTGEAA
jgi:L,D-transpeptidase catalytic domain